MRAAKSSRQLEAPINWQQLAHGDWLKAQVEEALESWWEPIFGYYLLKIGALSAGINSSSCRIRKQLSVAESGHVQLFGQADDLPFLQHSVDACMLAFVLDFANDPHAVMREVNRILMPDGHIIIVGFNPFSLVGVSQWWPAKKHHYPWHGRFFHPFRVKDWLSLLGCEVIAEKRCVFSSLAGASVARPSWQKVGHRALPWCDSVYLLLARKREVSATPIRQSWRVPVRLKPGQVLSGARKISAKIMPSYDEGKDHK